jgi:hypothetical protein
VSGHDDFFVASGCTVTNYGFLDLFVQEIFQERVVSRRQEEFSRLRTEREERISQILQSRRQERERMRKLKFYLSLEEERQIKLREQEEARKLEGNFFSFFLPVISSLKKKREEKKRKKEMLHHCRHQIP